MYKFISSSNPKINYLYNETIIAQVTVTFFRTKKDNNNNTCQVSLYCMNSYRVVIRRITTYIMKL
jgi:hypothetical protein